MTAVSSSEGFQVSGEHREVDVDLGQVAAELGDGGLHVLLRAADLDKGWIGGR